MKNLFVGLFISMFFLQFAYADNYESCDNSISVGDRYMVGEAWPNGTEGTAGQVGWVFHCFGNEPCKHGLMAAVSNCVNSDPSEDIVEVAKNTASARIKWGCANVGLGVKSDPERYIDEKGLGTTGKTNTEIIVNSSCCVDANTCAAKAAREYNGGGYDDWYLPSIDELSLMQVNLCVHNPLGKPLNIYFGKYGGTYWSSSEHVGIAHRDRDAYTQQFAYGRILETSKTGSFRVRPVRNF